MYCNCNRLNAIPCNCPTGHCNCDRGLSVMRAANSNSSGGLTWWGWLLIILGIIILGIILYMLFKPKKLTQTLTPQDIAKFSEKKLAKLQKKSPYVYEPDKPKQRRGAIRPQTELVV